MKKIKKAIIPVAGMGTRFLPATKATPKEMLPIVDKPTIQYIVEEAVNSGIEEIIFVTSPYKNSVLDHFDHSFELETRLNNNGKTQLVEDLRNISKLAKFYYVRQGEPLGTAHAVGLCESIIGDEPFAVMWGDDIVKGNGEYCLKKMIEIYEQKDCNVLCTVTLPPEAVPTKGVVKYSTLEDNLVEGIVEKPELSQAPSHDGTIGRYILKPEIFSKIKELEPVNGEYYLPVAMEHLMKEQKFYAYKLEEEYYDVGSKIGYVIANIAFALDNPDIKEELLDYLKKITM